MVQMLTDHPWIIILILLWSLPWKGVALWRSARRGQMGWFFALLVVNTLAILDIIYIIVFRNKEDNDNKQQEDSKINSVANPAKRPTFI